MCGKIQSCTAVNGNTYVPIFLSFAQPVLHNPYLVSTVSLNENYEMIRALIKSL